MKKIWVFICILLFLWACKKDGVVSEIFPGFVKPSNFPEPTYDFSRNQVTEDGFELGRRLFYEPRFSRNNTIACGSCHIQSAAFTHHSHDVSHGIDDRLGIRNPMPIMNLAWHSEFFWHGGVPHLDESPINAIQSEVEMDETVPNIIIKLREHPEYPELFRKAFGTTEITDARIFKALSQFMNMAVSSNSKYDKVMRKEAAAVFTEKELKGYQFFQKNCTSCHTEPLFTDLSYRNNGLQPNKVDDQGRYTATLNPDDKYRFKVPSLRNLEYTAPYMHDGRFLTLNRVLEHYRNGMIDSPTLDPIFRRADGSIGIPMTDEEKDNLLEFLKTLGDKDFLTNKWLSEPEISSGFVVN